MAGRQEDVVFAEHVLEKGYATDPQVQECLKLLARLREEMQLDDTLGNVLLKKGYVSQAQLRSVEAAIDPAKASEKKNAIPGYRLLERVGVGAMGAVYKAHHLKLDIPVAIKVLRTALSSSRTQVERLKREAQLVARLTHPNVVVSRDVGEADGIHYLVMEFVDGPTVRQLLRDGPLPEKRALHITKEAARALEHAHERGIIHRDVKPGNIMLSRKGQVKLADFGLARSRKPSDLTLEHASLGTPQYVAPEQMRRAGDARPRSDLFALGASLYHMVTGQPPFDGENLGEIVGNVLACRFPPPETVARDLSVDTLYIIHRLMRHDPRGRYATASDLIVDLEKIERGERVAPLAFRGDQKAYLRRKRIQAAVLGVAAVVVIAAIGFVAARKIQSGQEQEERAARCRTIDATGAAALDEVATVQQLRGIGDELRVAFESGHGCRADEVAALAQRLRRVEDDRARVGEAENAMQAADSDDANFRNLHGKLRTLRGNLHFRVAQEHVEKIARDIADRSREAARKRHTRVYFAEYEHKTLALEALRELEKDLRERFATDELVARTAADAAAYAQLIDDWAAAEAAWNYEEPRREHNYAEAWAKWISYRDECQRALKRAEERKLDPQFKAHFSIVNPEADLTAEERAYFRDVITPRAKELLSGFLPKAKVTRKEAAALLESMRTKTNTELVAQNKTLALLETRVQDALRERKYRLVKAQVDDMLKKEWLAPVQARLQSLADRGQQLETILVRFLKLAAPGDDWGKLSYEDLEMKLAFSDGRPGDKKLRAHFRWAESFHTPDPRKAAGLLKLALLDLDADDVRRRLKAIEARLPGRETEAKGLLGSLEKAEARKDFVAALIHCRRLVSKKRGSLRYTDAVDDVVADLLLKLVELQQRAGAASWREQASLPNDERHFNVSEAGVWTVMFDFRPWWRFDDEAAGRKFWLERFKTWGSPPAGWTRTVARAHRQLLAFSSNLVATPDGAAILRQNYDGFRAGRTVPDAFALRHPFQADKKWSVELVIAWDDPDGAEGGNYFALSAGRIQAGVVYTSHEKYSGGRGARLFESEAAFPDGFEKLFAMFRTRDRRKKQRLSPASSYLDKFDLRAGSDYRIRLEHHGEGKVVFSMGPAQGKIRTVVTRSYPNLNQRLVLKNEGHVFRFLSITPCRVRKVIMRGLPREQR